MPPYICNYNENYTTCTESQYYNQSPRVHRNRWNRNNRSRNQSRPFESGYSLDPHFPCVSREIREKWLINLTEEYIPDDVLDVACLGKKFGVPIIRKKDIPVSNIIASIESNMNIIEKDQRNAIRSICVDVISNFLRQRVTPRFPQLLEKVKAAKIFKISHPDIIFLKADKGNVTVAVNKKFYVSKMSELLGDSFTYRIIRSDPTLDIQKKVNKLLVKWYKNNFINDAEKSRLWSRNGHIALSYGQPKIHKKNIPFRMIVSFIGTPTYRLAKYIQRILTDCIKEEIKSFTSNKVSITNSLSLVKKIRSLHLPEDFAMISMDVISLFTNIPLALVISGIKSRWKLLKKYTKINQELFIEAVILCFNASAFQFNGIKYQQVFGAAMGSPLSPIIAEIVLQDLENFCMKKLDFPVYFYTRYVDDVLAFVPKDRIQSILSCFNSYHKRLQFTLEREENCRINFLEVTLIRNKRMIDFDWYRKPTSSGRYLNYYSHHPKGQKICTIYNLIDRGLLLSNLEFHLKNLTYIQESLVQNGYPRKLVLRAVSRRQALVLNPKNYYSDDFRRHRRINEHRWVTLPYVEGLSETLQSNLQGFRFSLSFRNDSNLRWLFTGHKDKLPRENQLNTVYKISCLECKFIFIEHTKRSLGDRIKEHYLSLRQPHNFPISNRLTEHAFRYAHDFDFKGVEVLAVESNYEKRELLSLIYKERYLPQIDGSGDRISEVSIYSGLFNP
uniref:AI1 protein n=1 Tax=Fopius arisanus TaxID=64838 RepID=A0A0C9RM79_9HYME